MKLVRKAWILKEKIENSSSGAGVLRMTSNLIIMTFHVVVKTRTAKKCIKMQNARAGRAELLFLVINLLGSLSMRVFETRTSTGREHFACQDNAVSQIFIPIIANGEKILSNVNVVCKDKLKEKTAHFRMPSASQKRACLSSLLLCGVLVAVVVVVVHA